jgi:hypothetical protein
MLQLALHRTVKMRETAVVDTENNADAKAARLRETAAKEAGWQKLIKKRHQIKPGVFIPDPAAAPIGTDQEAGGAISTPEGDRKYS